MLAIMLVGCGMDGGPSASNSDDQEVSCGAGSFSFPIGSLQDIQPLETADPGGVADAIAPFLESEEGDFWPQEGWHVLHQDDARVVLVARQEPGSLAFQEVVRSGSGWEWAGGSMRESPCRLEIVAPESVNTVDWRLDPDGAVLTPESTEVGVLLTERECVSGQEIGDRLLEPQVVITDDWVLVAFAAQPPEGDAFDCQGNPESPFTLELAEPLGERELVDGRDTRVILDDYLP